VENVFIGRSFVKGTHWKLVLNLDRSRQGFWPNFVKHCVVGIQLLELIPQRIEIGV
jgi:hypothetical protein